MQTHPLVAWGGCHPANSCCWVVCSGMPADCARQPALNTHVYAPVIAVQGGAGSNVSDYSHGTGFINWWGWDPVAPDRTYLTDVTAAVKRGNTVLNVSSRRTPGQPWLQPIACVLSFSTE
jgi:hypothetical protein